MFTKATVDRGARPLERRYYAADAIFDAERERIFARSWVCIGRAEQLVRPGDYFLATVAGESLIVVRDKAGQARAHFNVCRHRGTRICTTEQGRFSETIQCPYHAWTYALDGRLLAARNMRAVEGFEREQYGLHTAALAEWEGFLFVNLAAEPALVPFEQAYAPLIGKFGQWNMPALRVARTIEYDVQANWKLLFENYSECYHCPLIHPQLDRLSPSDSGRNDIEAGPFLGGYMDLNDQHGSLTLSGHTTRPPLGSVGGADLGRVYYYTLFPNVLLSLHPDYVMAHIITPQAANRTRIVCHWLFDPATMARPDFDPADAVEFWDLTNRQDWHVCELTQLGVSSRAYTPGPYAHAEGLLDAFDREYLKVMLDM